MVPDSFPIQFSYNGQSFEGQVTPEKRETETVFRVRYGPPESPEDEYVILKPSVKNPSELEEEPDWLGEYIPLLEPGMVQAMGEAIKKTYLNYVLRSRI